MKFRISRTFGKYYYDSPEAGDDMPCANCTYESWIDTSIFPRKHISSEEWWYSNGVNHRVLPNGEWARDFVWYGWFIEINTIEELLALRSEVGAGLIIYSNSIEIYDDERE